MEFYRYNNKYGKIRKWSIALLTLALLAAVFVGSSCGSTQETTTAPTTTGPTTTGPTATVTELFLEVEEMQAVGIVRLWLTTLGANGLVVETAGTINAELWLKKADGNELVQEWSGVGFTSANYTSVTKGAEISLLYNDTTHEYYELGLLKVTLTTADGKSITGELDSVNLLPSVLT